MRGPADIFDGFFFKNKLRIRRLSIKSRLMKDKFVFVTNLIWLH